MRENNKTALNILNENNFSICKKPTNKTKNETFPE